MSGVTKDWRTTVAVAIGVAIATAVIVGALLVGDSMRGSLKGLTVERLGKIETVIAPGGFFQVDHLLPAAGAKDADGDADAAIIFFERGVLESSGDVTVAGSVRRAGSVQIIGCDAAFWELDVSGVAPNTLPSGDEVVLSQSAAKEINVGVGDLVTVRLPAEQAVPADSPLGRRDAQTEGLPRMKVAAILPDRGLATFALSPSQAAPMNVFLSREVVADRLDRLGQANVLLADSEIDVDSLDVRLSDLGLNVSRKKMEFEGKTVYEYFSLTSDRLLLPELAADRIQKELSASEITPVMTYLANAIERLDDSGEVVESVPYSIITGIDSSESLPLDYQIPDDVNPMVGQTEEVVPLVINDWSADRLGAKVGTPLRIAFYEPEVEDGKEIERYFDAIVTAIVPITEPIRRYRGNRPAVFDRPPTIYNDPDLTPSVPGVTDQDSISDWDLPFTLQRTIPPEDDRYWNNHRLTPKAFLPIDDARKRFGSRFGQTTSLRISLDAADDLEQLEQRLYEIINPVFSQLGWTARSIRQQQLSASRGTTPFDGLFLALSFFVIFSAVMLIAMLLRLGLTNRLPQLGALMAIGWTPKTTTRLVLAEGAWIATIGVALGVLGGVAYAHGVLWALRNMWVGAVTVPFLNFHWTAASLLIGALVGWCVAMITVWLTIHGILKVRATTLLTGRDDSDSINRKYQSPAWLGWTVKVLPIIAFVVAVAGASVGGQAAAGGFVGAGMMLLVAALMFVYQQLRGVGSRSPDRSGETPSGRYSLFRLASRSASRSPLRSTLTIGLMATASFLIIAITAFRLQPTDRGTGGFDLVAQPAQPLYRDLSDPAVQSELLGPDKKWLEGKSLLSMRMRLGQDASCNNLYQAAQPTILGVPAAMESLVVESDGGRFDWAGFGDSQNPDTENQAGAWSLLQRRATGTAEDPIPMVLDQNTAMWSLQMLGGIGEIKSFEYEPNQPLFFKVVGLMTNSMLQGKLIVGEANFQTAFPDISGYQYFLIDLDGRDVAETSEALERRLGDVGMDVSDTKTVLSGMLAVQNTYLRTFQSLGALGLLLGTVGLAIAQLRAVLQRRRELAVMRAIGFTRRRLAKLVMGETAALLLIGIGCGAICAVIAVLPHALVSGMRPPVIEPLMVVGGIIVFGLLAGLLAVVRVIRMPLLQSLRAP